MNIKNEKIIEEYEKKQKRDRRQKIILIIIILLLIIFYLLTYRMGKIGYEKASTTSEESIKLIKITRRWSRIYKRYSIRYI